MSLLSRLTLFFGLALAGCQGPPSGVESTFIDDGGGARAVLYEDRDGVAYFEGDIVLGSTSEMRKLRRELQSVGHRTAVSVRLKKQLWVDGVVPYRIDPSVEHPERVRAAIEHFEEHTPVRFVEREQQEDFVVFQLTEQGCSSSVGRMGGEQAIHLSAKCSTGSIIHELGHAIGLWHEQSRSDRDDHVEILWENIKEDNKHNFSKRTSKGTDIGEYDLSSIMHYSPFAFSKNGEPTLTRKDGSTEGFGSRIGLSTGDIEAIEALYGQR